ncbi:transposase [Kalymmatonema gypsitolerans NIES-4073]|nr:transposase [Scytonema sp. NIES-4073]
MKTYLNDLRQKIINAYIKREGSYRKLAQKFGVSLSFVQTLINRYQDMGRIEPLPHGGGQKPKINDKHSEILQKLVAENNDATLEELCSLFELKTQIKVSRARMGRTLQKLQITRKKKPFMPANKIRTE